MPFKLDPSFRLGSRPMLVLFVLLTALAGALVMIGGPTVEAQSPVLPQFQWVATGSFLECGGSLRCAEWCMLGPNGPEPLGPPCCIDQSAVGGDDPYACPGALRNEVW